MQPLREHRGEAAAAQEESGMSIGDYNMYDREFDNQPDDDEADSDRNDSNYCDGPDDWGPTPEDISWGDGQAADMVYGRQ